MDRGLRAPVRRVALSPRPPTPAGALCPLCPDCRSGVSGAPGEVGQSLGFSVWGDVSVFHVGTYFQVFVPFLFLLFKTEEALTPAARIGSAPGPGGRGLARAGKGVSADVSASFLRAKHTCSETRGPAQRSVALSFVTCRGRAQVSPFEVTCGHSFLYRPFPQPCFSVTFCG